MVPSAESLTGVYATGQFKLNCCEFCDDVFAEVADIAFMDAWLPEYVVDGRGTNIVIARSAAAEAVLRDGASRGEICLEPLDISRVIESQDSCLLIKRTFLPYRLYLADHAGEPRPARRVGPRKPPWVVKRWLVAMRRIRQASLQLMRAQQHASPIGVELYETGMRRHVAAYFRWKRRYYTVHAYWQTAKRRFLRRNPNKR
jgi:coenzyme F420 hydrogenase subunit beta